jgi:hypothetical protein
MLYASGIMFIQQKSEVQEHPNSRERAQMSINTASIECCALGGINRDMKGEGP